MATRREPVTTPALKYGPTALYGKCEGVDCERNARATCTTCQGHFCSAHQEHDTHDEA